MERKSGVRVHDFIATLNELGETKGSVWEGRVSEVRTKMMEWAIEDVQLWHTESIQQSLRREFREVKPYDFVGKLWEAIEYIWSCSRSPTPVGAEVRRDAITFGRALEQRSFLLLRDASLKNQLLDFNGWARPDTSPSEDSCTPFPGADAQWFDSRIAERIVSMIPGQISWHDMRKRIWHVDFELACRTTSPEDDLIHVLAMEIFALGYDKTIERLGELLPNQPNRHFHEMMLFRCFRAWVRRLWYSRQAHSTYMSRYRHESMDYYYRLARSAAEQLNGHLGDNLRLFIDESENIAVGRVPWNLA
jgi:hypothetical protein